jgi:hypothetical protein
MTLSDWPIVVLFALYLLTIVLAALQIAGYLDKYFPKVKWEFVIPTIWLGIIIFLTLKSLTGLAERIYNVLFS